MITIQHYGEERKIDATAEERQIFESIKDYLGSTGQDVSRLELVRLSNDYVTAKYNDWDLVRIKYTDRAKWLKFPILEKASVKHVIGSPQITEECFELIEKSVAHIMEYS